MKLVPHFFFVLCFLSAQSQDFALKQLENSPRHHEWVELPSSGRTLYNFVAYPEVESKAPVVIVIHENRGLDDWARSMTDQLAAAGYIAIAPDLLSESAEGIRKTSDFSTSDDARKAIYSLPADQVTRDLNTVFDYAKKLPASTGNVYVMGFCWGGSQTFRYATNNDKMAAGLVFYGTAPSDSTVFDKIKAPIFGFYGGADARVNATIDQTQSYMDKGGKIYEVVIYDGAGHAFMRRGDDPNGDEPNINARNLAWERLKQIIR